MISQHSFAAASWDGYRFFEPLICVLFKLLETFLLATGDDPDEVASPIRQAEKAEKKADIEKEIEADVRPFGGELVKAYITTRAQYHGSLAMQYIDNDGKRKGAMVGELNRMFGGADNRHLCMTYITGKSSIKDLTDGGLLAMKDWLNFTQAPDNTWDVGRFVKQEAQNVLKEAMLAQGQKELIRAVP